MFLARSIFMSDLLIERSECPLCKVVERRGPGSTFAADMEEVASPVFRERDRTVASTSAAWERVVDAASRHARGGSKIAGHERPHIASQRPRAHRRRRADDAAALRAPQRSRPARTALRLRTRS